MTDATEPASIDVRPNGPLIVKHIPSLRNDAGEEIEAKFTVALCRCGASSKKPFCDGTHVETGFTGERDGSEPLDRTRAYEGAAITIHDNRRICSHAAECVHQLGSVFNRTARPWIDPDGATPEAIIELIKRCPSGALTYSMGGGSEVRDFDDLPTAITVKKDGPLAVTGKVHLEGELQPPSATRYELCRCGASKNKPFCDGTHAEIGFRGD